MGEELEVLGELLDLLSRKQLVEKSISLSTISQILTPMQKVEISQKAKIAEELIIILNTSMTEQEIIQRAKKINISNEVATDSGEKLTRDTNSSP